VKRFVALLLSFFLLSCGAYVQLPRNSQVNEKYKNIYYSSVAIGTALKQVVGSGTIIKNKAGEKMLILSVAHVARFFQENDKLVRILFPYKNGWLPVITKKIDSTMDLALFESIDVMTENGPYVSLSNEGAKIGDNIFTIGNPQGDRSILTKGSVSGIIEIEQAKKTVDLNAKIYRIDISSFFGNSGGGVFNTKGELIGAVSFMYISRSIGGVVPGANFCISINSIKVFLS